MNQSIDIPAAVSRSRRRLLASALATAALGILDACTSSPTATSTATAPVSGSAPTSAASTTQPASATALPTAQPTPANSAPSAAGAPTPASTASQAKTGGTLRIGQVGDLGNLDGHFYNTPQYYTIYTAYDRLTRYDAKQQPQSMLAESWDFSTDARQIKLNLRHGVQYHSGREFTSDDVKWNILRARDPNIAVQQFANQANWFTTIDTPDKYTVVLGSDQPRPAVFDFFELFNMLDSQSMDAPQAAARIVGTGPFVLSEYAQGDHISFKRNPSYWQSGKPYLDNFTVAFLKDAQSMTAQLEAGAQDLVMSPSPRDAVRLQSDDRYTVMINRQTGAVSTLAANTTLPPTDNQLLRQALNFALDRKRYADTVLLGTADPRSLPWRTVSPAYEASKEDFYNFDLEKAKSLVAQSGLSDVALDFVYNANITETGSLAQIYQADLASIGVNLNLTQVDNATFLDSVNKLNYHGVIGLAGFQSAFEPATGLTSSKNFNPLSNAAGFKSDQYAQLINAANIEPDLAKRKALYSQLNDILLEESFLMIVTTNPPILAVRSGVNGVAFDFHEGLVPADMWLS
jgi:peptide/nickel transport system substrate-binding protein